MNWPMAAVLIALFGLVAWVLWLYATADTRHVPEAPEPEQAPE